jgi:phosphate-selective porin OprO/OprP
VALDVIADSEVTFEGLVQADMDWYDMDFANLNSDTQDGNDADYELRRAELVLKGKGPGNFEWVAGYDAKADKWLDVNIKYKIGGNANNYFQVGQFKQLNSLEELSSTKNNDFISKASVTNTFGIARRLGVMYNFGDNDWAIQASYFVRELTEHPAPTPHGSSWARTCCKRLRQGDRHAQRGPERHAHIHMAAESRFLWIRTIEPRGLARSFA